ncbi:MAG: glycosyltransferase family 4 protein [Geminicoccaceae bacterium]
MFVINDTAFFVSHRLPLALGAQEAGFEVHLAALDAGRLGEIQDHGIAYHRLEVDRTGVNPWHDFQHFRGVLQVLRMVRPTIVHAVTIKPVIYAGIAARLMGVPALVSAVSGLGFVFADGEDQRRFLRHLVWPLYRIALGHRNSRAIFQNPDDRRYFVQAKLIDPERAVLIRGSGVDPSIFVPHPEPPGRPVVVLPARLFWEKGVKEFVEAAQILRQGGSDARFVLVGEPPAHIQASVPRATIERWARQGVVEWWGYRPDMPEVYARCHIVCLPSYYREGIPRALIEAASCGRPIVTTDAPGCREVVRHGESGLLVPPRSATALAEALRTLLADPERRIRMGRQGRALATTEFALDRVVGATLEVYQNLCGRRPARGE